MPWHNGSTTASLKRPVRADGAVIGSKAKTLVELAQAGFRVPAFLCSPVDLAAAVRKLGTPLVVRSSASIEDGAEASFAGQFKSFLNLSSVEEVRAAIAACQEATHSASVKEYCREHHLAAENLRMGYIVQRMIQPELAGVAFTVNPATGAEEVVIEACAGLADELLLGRQPSLSPNHELMRRYAPEITRVARSIQRHFGTPQDIEFAVQDGELFILQARPITRIQFAPETGVWTNADFRDGGVSSTVCTPLMWSLYDFIWEETLKGFLRDIKLLGPDFQAGRMFFGRPYWNLGAVKECLAKLPGFNERQFDEDLSIRAGYNGDGLCTPVTLSGVIKALPTVFAVQSIWRKQEQFDQQFLAGGFEALIAPYRQIASPALNAFTHLVNHAYRITETNYFKTIYCASLAKLAFTDSFPECDYASLVAELPPLTHFEPTRILGEMRAHGHFDFESFVQRFGHHSRRELDIREPRWDEDPDWVRALFDQALPGPDRSSVRRYEQARSDAINSLPWYRRRAFARKLDRLRRFLWLREEMRDLSSRMYHLIRRYVLAIGKERGLGDDVFFMTFQEILADDRTQIDLRREQYESYRNFRPPNEIGIKAAEASPICGATLRGIAASRGTVQGLARVVRNIEDAAQVETGAILICPFTDPGWTPILARVAGVVTETGGLLSHAAIICREYGIPALLSVPEATRRIPDCSQILLRADESCVTLTSTPKQTPCTKP